MEKIRLLSDSACDLSLEAEQELGVRIINIPLSIRGKVLMDRVDITVDEVYQELWNGPELPTTAHINANEFMEEYLRAAEEGYTEIIYVGLNSKGSSTFQASVMGKKLLFEEHPELVGKVRIRCVDSLSYSFGYGLPLMLAADMVKQGKSADEIVDFLVDFFDHQGLCFSIFTLQFAKRSGRIGTAASFVGEVLGLRPIMGFPGGKNAMVDKVRGDKSVVPKLFDIYRQQVDPRDGRYVIIHGEDDAPAKELAKLLQKHTGMPPLAIEKAGACVTINAGPRLVGLAFRERSGGKYKEAVQ